MLPEWNIYFGRVKKVKISCYPPRPLGVAAAMSVPPIHARTVRPNGLAPADRTELKSRVEKKRTACG